MLTDLNLDEVVPDFRGVQNFKEIESRFLSSARSIMLQHRLTLSPIKSDEIKYFDITSLELYLKLHKNREVWWDEATDEGTAADEQFNRATWYVMQARGPAYQLRLPPILIQRRLESDS